MHLSKLCNSIKATLDNQPAFPTAYFQLISFLYHIHVFLMLINSLSLTVSLLNFANSLKKICYSISFFCVIMARTLIKIFILAVEINDLIFCIFP